MTTTCAPIARARSSSEARLARRSVGLQQGDEPVGLRQRLDPGVADRHEAVGGDIGMPGLGEASGPGLDHDDREMVGDDVVQVAGDPRSLALDGEADERLLLGFERARSRRRAR